MERTRKIIGWISCFFIVLNMMFLYNHEVEAEEPKKEIFGTFYIDTQYNCKTFEGRSVVVKGWIMTSDPSAQMKLYVDGQDTKTDFSTRTARPDVLAAIKGYGGAETNPNPGFEGILDISSYTKGEHTVTYCLEQVDGREIYSESYQVYFDNEAKGTFDIDNPNIYGNTATTKEAKLKVNGWIMSNDAKATINIYIDGTKMQTSLTRTKRPDVLNAIKGYGGKELNPEPGFETTIDLTQISHGMHKMTYQLEMEDGKIIAKKSANIQIKKGEFYIDTQYNCTKFEGKSIFISGWSMTNDPSVQMKLYVDGQDTKTDFSTRIVRPDVLNAIKGYGGKENNPLPGFEGILDISLYSDGEHTVTYCLEQADGKRIESKDYKVVFHKEIKGTFDIDTPNPYKETAKIKQDKITVNGWIMSTDRNATLRILIDNQDTNATIEKRIVRADVLDAISGYDKNLNALPGFSMEIDISSYQAGEHNINYQLKASSGEILGEKKAKINIEKAEFYIEKPTFNLWEGKNIIVSGWIMALDETAKMKILINGNEINVENMKRIERPDVIAAIKGYGGKENNPLPGFEGQIDISGYTKGQYDLTYCVQSENGETLVEKTKKITIDNTPKAMVDIDTPNWRGVENTDGKIIGWVMTNIQNPKIRVFIDQYEKEGKQKRVERPDVLQAISGYGGKENNPTPGFVIDMKYGDFEPGTHTLKIVIEDETGKQISVKTRDFPILKAYTLEEGTFGPSGLKVKGEWKGSDLKYYKIGDGPNVFFATFAVHGFEDKWDYDGKELTIIAEEFKNRLVSDKDRSILSKWTIYIFPQVNPDGVNYGWSNNGPGRRTLYSWAPENEGIDMNRCWQSGNYTRYTGRNYNGTGPFQAYEAGYLKDFLLEHKATNGQTVLIDLHGWTTQLIGDYGICHECYAPYFPTNSYTGSYGTGYLINWARSSLGANGRSARSALIELPSAGINSHQDVVNAGYAVRYINATLYMLKVLE